MPLLRRRDRGPAGAEGAAAQPPRAERSCGQILAFLFDFATARAIRRSLKLPAQEPEPLAHSPPEPLELIAESA